jgi:site-specific DNA recombinase
MIKAICYSRFSPRPNAADCDSCAHQFDRQRAYCAAMGWEVIGEERDEAVSGDKKNRQGFNKALDAVCKAKGVLVVYDLSRFARDMDLACEAWRRLEESKAHLACVVEGINTLSSVGKSMTRLVFVILSGIAEYQKAQISEKTSDYMRRHQDEGRRMGRPDRCPYGTMPDWNGPMIEKVDKETGQVTRLPARLIDNPEEQAVIEQIRLLRSGGKGSKSIARALDAQGIACRGHGWNYSTVRAILRRVARNAEALCGLHDSLPAAFEHRE